MGQRHQVYVKTPVIYDHDGSVYRASKLIGIHHHWLYGQGAVILLRNFLEFCEKNNEAHFGDTRVFKYGHHPEEMLASVYTSDRTLGYYSGSVHALEDLQDCDPRDFDNNDGIAIMDLNSMKYCFMFLEPKPPEKELTILSAHNYLVSYYPDYLNTKVKDKDGKMTSGKKAFHLVRKAIKDLEQYEILSVQEVKAIFPMLPVCEKQSQPAPDAAVLGKQNTQHPKDWDAVLGNSN